MAIYKLVKDPISNQVDSVMKTISTTSDGGHTYLSIPILEENKDYQEYLAWVAEGNTADAAD